MVEVLCCEFERLFLWVLILLYFVLFKNVKKKLLDLIDKTVNADKIKCRFKRKSQLFWEKFLFELIDNLNSNSFKTELL